MLSIAMIPALAAAVVALVPRANEATTANPVLLPLSYKFGADPRIVSNIYWGTPAQSPSIETAVDLSSSDFWVFGPKSTINWGSSDAGVRGPCFNTAEPYYNNTASKSATKQRAKKHNYSYDRNDTFVTSYFEVNDTISFGNAGYPALSNQDVAVANYTLVRIASVNECQPIEYDRSVLGLSRYVPASSKTSEARTQGPSFRQDILDQGLIESSTLSMWFDAPPSNVSGTFQGSLLLGAVPTSKYSGALVQIATKPPTGNFVGYYAATPSFQSAPLSNPNAKQTLKLSDKVPQCLFNSRSSVDILPIDQDAFLKLTGLTTSGDYPAYNGPCSKIPTTATIDFTFAGLNSKSVTIKVPLRNYARGIAGDLGDGKCALSLQLGAVGNCVLGAPFFTGAFIAINDEKSQFALAQGGVSSGAAKGVSGLGAITVVKKGQGLP